MKYNFPYYNLDEFCTFEQGVQIPSSEAVKQIETGYIRYLYIRDFYTDQFKVFVKDIYPNKILKETDVIMVNTGATAGDVYRGKTGVLCNNAFVIRVKTRALNKLDNGYLWYYLNSEYKKRFLNKLFNSAGQPHVGHKNVALFKIPLPPLPEQRKIAEILSTWDEAIAKTEALIAALEQRKKGLMQRLLTGQVRFPGFTDPWREVRLGEISKIITGSTPSTKNRDFYGTDILFVSPADLGDEKYISNSIKKLSLEGFQISRKIQKGSILFSCIGLIGKIGIAHVDLATNQQINSLIPKNIINNEFLYYLLLYLVPRIQLMASKNVVPIINKSEFEKIKIKIPSKSEQKEIARILCACDEQINFEQRKKNVIKEQKKGLMQRLLTGEVRVKV